MLGTQDLAHLNAALNATSAILLGVGFVRIRRGDREGHRRAMLAAFWVSVAFLVSYVVYHALHGSKRFTGEGWLRPVYFSILVSHIVLAATVPPLAVLALWRGLRGEFERHKRVVRWAWPIWMYVSITGVLVYLMLYGMRNAG